MLLKLAYDLANLILIITLLPTLYNTQLNITFHWIPSHTHNKLHSQVDNLATQALQYSDTSATTTCKVIKSNTDAIASGGVNNPSLAPLSSKYLQKKKKQKPNRIPDN